MLIVYSSTRLKPANLVLSPKLFLPDSQVMNRKAVRTPVLSSSFSIALFLLIACHRARRQKIIERPQPAMRIPPPCTYRGSWCLRKKYGENQCDTLETQLANATSAALLVRGRGTTVVSQESCSCDGFSIERITRATYLR